MLQNTSLIRSGKVQSKENGLLNSQQAEQNKLSMGLRFGRRLRCRSTYGRLGFLFRPISALYWRRRSSAGRQLAVMFQSLVEQVAPFLAVATNQNARSEERRVGKECRCRWA